MGQRQVVLLVQAVQVRIVIAGGERTVPFVIASDEVELVGGGIGPGDDVTARPLHDCHVFAV
ncbi:hypothetical protein D3C80_1737900 [compost metagenome]